jgi:DNA-directed RNA polymerase specialized sigma24 family protein
MTLDDLVDSLGRPLPEELQVDLKRAILRAVVHPESDVPAVMQRAQAIARKALDGEIRDVLHYATRALFAVSRKRHRLRLEQTRHVSAARRIGEVAVNAIHGSPAAIEAKILVDQLLNDLPRLERYVFVRHSTGWKHKKIAQELGISLAMSSYYLLRAKARLGRLLNG